MSTFNGQQLAQVNNSDPFAPPVWRSPVLHTPGWVITIVQAWRLLKRLIIFLMRHPVLDTVTLAVFVTWRYLHRPGLIALAVTTAAVLAAWRWRRPGSFHRLITAPAFGKWRRGHYLRPWTAVMTIGHLAPIYRGRLLVPVLGKVTSTRYTDRVAVRMVSGQCPADFAARAENLAHGFGALLCRIRTARPGWLILELVRRDALAAVMVALPVHAHVNFKALPIGRCEDGTLWCVRVLGTHLLIAGSTGAGKASLVWGIIRALLPAMARGLVRVHGADPKRMELAYGRAIFDTYGSYDCDPAAIADMLDQAVTDMQDRADRLAGRQRDHLPTVAEPLVLIIVDEVAFLTAYQTNKTLRDRTLHALATLTTQGRAAGFVVIAALQDPRKEVLTIRNLFPDRIAMRLDEASQVDMVLGDGAHDRGAFCEHISADPATGAGVGFVRLEDDPDPVRVRAAWVSDSDIKAMCAEYAAGPRLAVEEVAA
jgi:S-DNA-T family DNA segregation ATPase FtsK/SpoIIIE